jgi:hypothetical protein
MCRREIVRVVSRFGVLEALRGESLLGLIRAVILVCAREWDEPVRLITMGTMSTCVLGECARSAFVRGVCKGIGCVLSLLLSDTRQTLSYAASNFYNGLKVQFGSFYKVFLAAGCECGGG